MTSTTYLVETYAAASMLPPVALRDAWTGRAPSLSTRQNPQLVTSRADPVPDVEKKVLWKNWTVG